MTLEAEIEFETLFMGEFYEGFIYAGMHSIDKTGYVVVVDHDKEGYIILERDLSVSGIWATIMSMEDNQTTEFHAVDEGDKFQKMDDIVP